MSEEERRLARRQKPVSGSVEDYQSEEEDSEGPSQEDIERFSDVTIKCKKCGTELLDDVAECWKCREPVQRRHTHETGLPTWVVVTALVLLALLIGWLVF